MRKGVVQFTCETIPLATYRQLLERGRIVREVGVCSAQRLLLLPQAPNQQADEYANRDETDGTNDGNEYEDENILIIDTAEVDQSQLEGGRGNAEEDDVRQS